MEVPSVLTKSISRDTSSAARVGSCSYVSRRIGGRGRDYGLRYTRTGAATLRLVSNPRPLAEDPDPEDLPWWLRMRDGWHPKNAEGEGDEDPNGRAPHGGLLLSASYCAVPENPLCSFHRYEAGIFLQGVLTHCCHERFCTPVARAFSSCPHRHKRFILPSSVTPLCPTIISLEILHISVTILFRNNASFAFGEVDL